MKQKIVYHFKCGDKGSESRKVIGQAVMMIITMTIVCVKGVSFLVNWRAIDSPTL